jgi:hypothetical protein
MFAWRQTTARTQYDGQNRKQCYYFNRLCSRDVKLQLKRELMLSATRELYLRQLNTVTYPISLVEHYNLNKRSRKPKRAIKNGQSRDTGNIWYTSYRTETNKDKMTTQKIIIMSNMDATQKPGWTLIQTSGSTTCII